MSRATICLHGGAHCGVNRFINAILTKNRGRLVRAKIGAPNQVTYQEIFESSLASPTPTAPETEARIQWGRERSDELERVVFSNQGFLGGLGDSIGPSGFYPEAEERLAQIASFFPDHELAIFLNIEPISRFIPRNLKHLEANIDVIKHAESVKPQWSQLILRVLDTIPNAQIFGFDVEQLRWDWPALPERLLGTNRVFQLNGILEYPRQFLSSEQSEQIMKRYSALGPREETYREVFDEVILPLFKPIEFPMAIDRLGWTTVQLQEFERLYAEDLRAIQKIPNAELFA